MKCKVIITITCTLSLLVFLSAFVQPEQKAEPPVGTIVSTVDETVEIPETLALEADEQQSPFTEEEIMMLAKTIYAESQVLSWHGDQYGVSYQARQAAVAWCALNRYDAGGFGDTLAEVLSRPAQFAYREDTPLTDEMLSLARDVIYRWQRESGGETDVGRTLPADYLFFEGDGKENHFRKQFEHTGETWDWSLSDPYKEEHHE